MQVNIRKLTILVALTALLALSGGVAQGATTLTVDASAGTVDFGDACPSPTDSAAYKSLQAAIDCAEDGDTLEVYDGIYGVTGQTGTCEGFAAAIRIANLDNLTIQAASGQEPVVIPIAS